MDEAPKKPDSKTSCHPLNEVFSDASQIFSLESAPATSLMGTAIVVLDTNTLLAPYSLQTEQLADIEKVLKPLVDAKRLFIPGQVAREFAKNRAEKLKQIHDHLTKARNATLPSIPDSPLLRAHVEYLGLKSADELLRSAADERNRQLDKLLEVVRGWTWNDPVSELYRRIGLDKATIEPKDKMDILLKDLERRNSFSIPPGYKDAGKDDNAGGDLLIWHAILRLGRDYKNDLLFVSGDIKSDWWHQSAGRPLYPRFELLYEYSSVSNGKKIQMLSYSDFLSIAGASPQIVQTLADAGLASSDTLLLDSGRTTESVGLDVPKSAHIMPSSDPVIKASLPSDRFDSAPDSSEDRSTPASEKPKGSSNV